ncbi:hypothetical protein [Halonatronum saccharophilum]|uniref:hypothetical protein n=1 Tax=Halonatronum saccharophilum TaxID=150060 RepID=UPI00048A1A4C|nr:hypothetical protein [Halonatronum saccharophilum]
MSDNVIIDLENKMILLKSEITQEYPWFYDFLEKNITNDITLSTLKRLNNKQKNFIHNMRDTIIEKAKQEWTQGVKGVYDMGKEDRKPCSICHRPTRYVCYISNIRNGNELNVGKDCLKKFGIKTTKSFDLLIKEAKKVKRLETLNNEIPGIKKIIYNWDKQLNYSILIPERLSKPYKLTGKEIKQLFDGYINTECEEEVFSKIKTLLDVRKIRIKKMKKYVDDNKNKKYIPTKRIIDWLKRKQQISIIKQLEKDEVITCNTAQKITEPSFMEIVGNDLKIELKSIGIKITNVNLEKRGYSFNLFKENNIKLFCKHNTLISYCGYLIFDTSIKEHPKLPSLENIIKISTVSDEDSIYPLLSKLKPLFNNLNLNIYGYNLERNNLTIQEKNSRKYIELNLNKSINQLKNLALSITDDTEFLIKKINSSNNKKYSKNDINHFNEVGELIKL